MHRQYNYGKLHYRVVEVPLLEVHAKFDRRQARWASVGKWVTSAVLGNRTGFRLFQAMTRRFLGPKGITHMYVLTRRA